MRRQQKPSVMTSCSCVLFYTALLLLTWGCSAVPTTREQLRSYFELDQDSPQEGGRAKRQAITRPTGKWPNATAYYGFDPTFPATGQDAVRMATAYWEANTCIRFTFVPDINNPPFQPVIKFFQSPGCYSNLGMQAVAATQDLSLADHCQQATELPVDYDPIATL
uniref:Astacin domain-containing protein n=1 Tax=Steinernema glaseri TaxID=37863 RepID=A0A1I8AHN0_9BILA